MTIFEDNNGENRIADVPPMRHGESGEVIYSRMGAMLLKAVMEATKRLVIEAAQREAEIRRLLDSHAVPINLAIARIRGIVEGEGATELALNVKNLLKHHEAEVAAARREAADWRGRCRFADEFIGQIEQICNDAYREHNTGKISSGDALLRVFSGIQSAANESAARLREHVRRSAAGRPRSARSAEQKAAAPCDGKAGQEPADDVQELPTDNFSLAAINRAHHVEQAKGKPKTVQDARSLVDQGLRNLDSALLACVMSDSGKPGAWDEPISACLRLAGRVRLLYEFMIEKKAVDETASTR